MDRASEAARISAELKRESFAPSRGSIRILETTVPSTVSYREAATAGVPIHRYEARRRGPTPSGRDITVALARELFPHLLIDEAMLAEG